MASVLPVFILALVVEARASLRPQTKKQRREAKKEPRWKRVLDSISVISYTLAFALAMVLLVTGFVLTALVLVTGDVPPADSRSSVLLIVVIGVAITGLLPVASILSNAIFDRAILPGLNAWRKRIRKRDRGSGAAAAD